MSCRKFDSALLRLGRPRTRRGWVVSEARDGASARTGKQGSLTNPLFGINAPEPSVVVLHLGIWIDCAVR